MIVDMAQRQENGSAAPRDSCGGLRFLKAPHLFDDLGGSDRLAETVEQNLQDRAHLAIAPTSVGDGGARQS